MEFENRIIAVAKDGNDCGKIVFVDGEYMHKMTDNRYCINAATAKQIAKKLKELNNANV